jgi:hypothetical protein
MGNNIDFPYLFNIPIVRCPDCKNEFTDQLSEWDIDCGTLHEEGIYSFDIECDKCNKEFTIEIQTNTKVLIDGEEIKEYPKCKECNNELQSDEEIEFGECNKCCAWKYRENSK